MADLNKTSKPGFGQLFSFKNLEVEKTFKGCRPLVKSRNATLLAAPAPELERGKLLCIAGRAVGNACVRNRLKRLAKSIFLEQQFFSKKFRFILIFKPKCALDRSGLEDLLNTGMQKLDS